MVPYPNYPSYSGWNWTGGHSSVSFAVYPASITLQGTTKFGSQDNILIGQNCIASLDIFNLPAALTMGTPTWSIPGDVFTAFNISSDQSSGDAVPYPDTSQALPIQPEFYWRDNGALTGSVTKIISATAPIYSNSGATYIGEIAATKPVNVWVPDEYDTPPGSHGNYAPNPQLGTVGFGTGEDAKYVISNDPSGNTDGIDLQASVVTPALFTASGHGFGNWAWLQQCQIDETQGGNLNH